MNKHMFKAEIAGFPDIIVDIDEEPHHPHTGNKQIDAVFDKMVNVYHQEKDFREIRFARFVAGILDHPVLGVDTTRNIRLITETQGHVAVYWNDDYNWTIEETVIIWLLWWMLDQYEPVPFDKPREFINVHFSNENYLLHVQPEQIIAGYGLYENQDEDKLAIVEACHSYGVAKVL